MRTIAMLAQKGGVGKTTLAVHLAVCAGKNTFLVDADPQGSAATWHSTREADWPLLAQGDGKKLKPLIKAAEGEGAETVIIDTPPHNESLTSAVATAADLVVIPTRPTILDLSAIGATVATVQKKKAKAVIVLSACPPRSTMEPAIVSEARSALAGYGLPVFPGQITQRVAFSHSLIDGQAVTEFEPSGKAALEINQLYQWLLKQE